jgi:hypothetical protein
MEDTGLSEADMKEVEAQGERLLAFWKTLPAVMDSMKEPWRLWMEDFMNQRYRRFAVAVSDALQKLREGGDEDGVPEVKIASTGLRHLDVIAALVVDTSRKWLLAEQKLERELKQAGYYSVLEPENLVSMEGIKRGRETLARGDAFISAYVAEVEQLMGERERGMRAVQMPRKEAFLASAEKGLVRAYTLIIENGESLRKIADAKRRMLALAESRSGQLVLENGTLIYPSDEDVKLARSIFAEIGEAAAKMEADGERQLEFERKAMAAAAAGQPLPKAE